jgi:hypothetical protein
MLGIFAPMSGNVKQEGNTPLRHGMPAAVAAHKTKR